LWVFDHPTLTIRPFFPRERKKVYIKVPEELVDATKRVVEEFLAQIFPGTVYNYHFQQ
jgi:hypothetical protein